MKPSTEIYTQLAFGSAVVAGYSQLAFSRSIRIEGWEMAGLFLLGAAYAILGMLCKSLFRQNRNRSSSIYFSVQFALVAAVLGWGITRSSMLFILALPLGSQAIFNLRWRWATLINVALCVMCVGPFWIRFNSDIARQATLGITPAFFFTTVFTIITVNAIRSREQAEQLAHKLANANEQLQAAAQREQELATTRERNRLAREIHDGIGHFLTTINVQLEAARATRLNDPAQSAQSLENAARLSREALDDIRRSVGTLREDTKRPPLPEMLRALAADAGLPATVHVEGAVRSLQPAAEHALFRSAQEGLTNVRKHTRASEVCLTLDFRDAGRVALIVTDNGPAHVNGTTGGYGLTGLRERFELLGGKITAAPTAAGGFILRAEVPA